MLTRILALCVVLIATQSAVAEKRSLVVHRTTHGAIVPAPQAPERSVVAASREVPVGKSDKAADTGRLLKEMERELERLQAEIKQLKAGLGTDAQILVRIEMLEVSLTKLRKMGTDFTIPSGAVNAKDFNSIIASMIENRVAKSLCQPNIVVISGRPGSFHVGGEIPIPSRHDPKAVVGFQKTGTEVDLLAIATDKQHVRMELRVKQSEIDEAHSVEINGSRVPALKTRQCDTAVEATFGEPVVFNGMTETRRETRKTDNGMQDEDNEITLMIVVIPELVEPIPDAKSEPIPSSIM
jgi:Flp pilus assembly secretin CpaC